jgi:hypothetical protein
MLRVAHDTREDGIVALAICGQREAKKKEN